MNPIVLAALALIESNPQPFIEPYPIKRRYMQPDKTPDLARQAAAEAKRKRKADKRINNYAKGELGNAHIFMAKRKYEHMSKPCDCDVCTAQRKEGV